MWTVNFLMFKLVLPKAEEPEIKLPTSAGSWEKQESSRKPSISALLTMPKPFDCVDHNKMWKILKEMGIPDHLICLLRNLYAGQEAPVRTGHGTTDWFQIGKGVYQGPAQVGSRDSLRMTALAIKDSKAEILEAHYNWFRRKINKVCDTELALTTEAAGALSNRWSWAPSRVGLRSPGK